MVLSRGARTDGLARTAPASARARLDTILLHVRPVGMARSRVHVHGLVAIVLFPLVLVHDAHANRRAQRDAELGS